MSGDLNHLGNPKWHGAKTSNGQKTHHGNTVTGPVGKPAVGSLATARGGLYVLKVKKYHP